MVRDEIQNIRIHQCSVCLDYMEFNYDRFIYAVVYVIDQHIRKHIAKKKNDGWTRDTLEFDIT